MMRVVTAHSPPTFIIPPNLTVAPHKLEAVAEEQRVHLMEAVSRPAERRPVLEVREAADRGVELQGERDDEY